ncbi:Mediator complex, subunit Med19, fungi [Lasallia pustulata]|uniref:Mediator of RNA polymerase II transcription subunit 19 n=1 Tax=Lasallia pustulata TaxID=136370 RepID=A0A1W5CXC1_9LECA|nr:Mediator complex, subunit Med19, fungi [Lasallia pustulata]
MNTQASHPATVNTSTTQYGQTARTHDSQTMDIDTDGQSRPGQDKEEDVMDTSLDLTREAQSKGKEADRGDGSEAPVALQSEPETKPEGERSGTAAAAPYLLCKTAHVLSRPHPTQDLLSLYGLNPLAATVARTDPNTGEKINKMRKSYEGKIKAFGLAGRNKAVKYEGGKNMGLVEMMKWPDDEWHNQKVVGKEVSNGLPAAIMAKLERAMKMEPGPVPNNEFWEDALGHEKAKALSAVADSNKKPVPPVATSTVKAKPQTNGTSATAGTQATPGAARPKRSGMKRSYDEHSFEGYGEGYVDDDVDPYGSDGYSSSKGSRKSLSKKKRKKEYGATSPPAVGERSGSYGVGMVGIGTGIGAYGR